MEARFAELDEFTREPRVAYFSMEIALRNDIPTYSGGLGVLAGDYLRSAADLDIPIVAVTLASRRGYFRQEIAADGSQIEKPEPWNPADHALPLAASVGVAIEGREVWIRGWLYTHASPLGVRQPAIILDTDWDQNDSSDRELTHYLYGGDTRYRFAQEIILGIGGVRLLRALGFRIRHYHMNEGHAALLGIELLRRMAYPHDDLIEGESPYDVRRVREVCNFTTHTPVEAGHDKFSYDLVRQVIGEPIELEVLKSLGGERSLNMTQLALQASEFVNGVSARHAEVSGKMFPGYAVRAIENGVHLPTWASPHVAAVLDESVPGWRLEPERLVRADQIADATILAAHQAAKRELVELVNVLTNSAFRSGVPIVSFARRMTEYKRPDMLFADRERLRKIARQTPFQILVAGKAHPHDVPGKALVRKLHEWQRELSADVPMAYLPNYDLRIALAMVAGSDVWLNTPTPPLEASGTSGMKAAVNGVPSLSILDGWWIQGCVEGVTGWSITDVSSLYDKLERTVLPLYYAADRTGWAAIAKGAIAKNAPLFNSHRMIRRYAAEVYGR